MTQYRIPGLLLLLLVPILTIAQKKLLTFEQIFGGAPVNGLENALPDFVKWTDDDHYVINKGGTWWRTDVKTGNEEVYNEPASKTESPYDKETNATLSPDKKRMAFTRNNDLYVVELATKKETRLTNDGGENIYNGYAAWLYYEEILGRASHYKAFWWSNDSKHIAFMRFDESQVPVFPIYVADGQHGSLEKQHYPKAGDPNPAVKIGIAHMDNNSITWAAFNEKDDQYFGTPIWSPNGQLLVQWLNRDQNDYKLYAVNAADGSKKELYNEKQKTWIALDEENRISFTPDEQYMIIKSDKSGWIHLYLYKLDGTFVNAITQGNYTVTDIVKVNSKTKTICFKARKESSARFDLYKCMLDGKNFTRLTFGDFSHDDIILSPNDRYFVTTYSNINTPPCMALVDALNGKLVKELVNSKGSRFDSYALPVTKLVRIKSTDGLFDLPMTITYPVNFDSTKKYPVLMSVYGGPGSGTVFDKWLLNNKEIQWWAQEGVIQVTCDNRSSGHFGKAGEDYIYRQMGIYEIEDFMACGKWLKSQKWVDGNKICMEGGSFGGYMTCMALTYGAEVFTHGVASYSVTDWSLYDTHYTERYMDTPSDNPDGYKYTSVMTYVDRYKGLLRIVHGTTDDNVHLQNTLQLINKLEDNNKHFELMLYPNERHGIGYNVHEKGLHNLLDTYKFYYDNLLQRPMPAQFGR